ncbi:MAG: (d)CMP kinase [Acidimicrobiia bacterium]|nr:(d)CMP kinase [Acidimicrobiia bacterium]
MADGGAIVVVAIDGPAGSGKSTVARRLADEVGLEYLDTGAMYRAATLAVLRAGVEPGDEPAVAEVTRRVDIELRSDGTIHVDGVDSTAAIRFDEVNKSVSEVAANAEVRTEMVERQRRWARIRGGGVLEGRDIGTVVFPDADLKVYLTASPDIRARRRAGESGHADVEIVAADLARRDDLDSQRSVDPLRQADDATVIDTSDLTIDDVVEKLSSMLATVGRQNV